MMKLAHLQQFPTIQTARRTEPKTRPYNAPKPGAVFVFPTPDDTHVEWAFLADHQWNPEIGLFVALDEFPLVGSLDVNLSLIGHRPLAARCGVTDYFPIARCKFHPYRGQLPNYAVRMVLRKLAELEGGEVSVTAEAVAADEDPEYKEWMDLVDEARQLAAA